MIESSGHIVATRHCNESHPEVGHKQGLGLGLELVGLGLDVRR